MKRYLLVTLVLSLIMIPLANASDIPSSCLQVKNAIKQKIIHHGVKDEAILLTIVPSNEVSHTKGKEVGNCANQRYKIIYQRTNSSILPQQEIEPNQTENAQNNSVNALSTPDEPSDIPALNEEMISNNTTSK